MESRFIWVWRKYQFRGEEVLVTRTLSGFLNAPATVSYRGAAGETVIERSDFEKEAKLVYRID